MTTPGAFSLLSSLDLMSLILLFWYTTLVEVPRYVLSGLVGGVLSLWPRRTLPGATDFTLSVVLVGHNEAHALRACVEALAEQTIASDPDRMEVIVVDDGSTDSMSKIARDLQRQGKVNDVLRLDHRGGKSAGVNLAISACSGDVVIIADIDTTFDRDAFANMLIYFDDPRVGAVSGNLGVRNASASLVGACQAIEYAIGISLGRQAADALGWLTVVSGAFGAFRRTALESVGRQDVEVGEDADLTMKLRGAGWRVRFALEARALTDVPETVAALIGQRLRWDRGLITIWARKFRGTFNPARSTFRLGDVASLCDVILFQIVLALAFPAYLLWLAYHFGTFAWTVIAATLAGYFLLDLVAFAGATIAGVRTPLRLLAYLPAYTVLQISIMRIVRLIAIFQEVIFHSSYRDPYVPRRVMQQVEMV
jgi:cellulose synthase/poly-beta-1,6-N-acetylglucosamine synthase-like glycosyltransferase